MTILYTPTMSVLRTERNLSRLIVRGIIKDHALDRYAARLSNRFQVYSSLYPFGLWDNGLAVTVDMRAITELYLPMAEIASAFRRLFSLSLRRSCDRESAFLSLPFTWLDLLQRLHRTWPAVDPGRLLERLTKDDDNRIRFIFTLMLPAQHGGSFHRYPGQTLFLDNWIQRRSLHRRGEIRVLDAACGTGESSYELAMILRSRGVSARHCRVHGCSLEIFELFAAAHGFFPHDPGKELVYRGIINRLLRDGGTGGIVFFQGDVTHPPQPEEKPYHVILCNGLLGGPYIHTRESVATAIESLAARLGPGGIMLISDRFHGGWKKKMPQERLKEIFRKKGFRLIPVTDGIAAELE